MNTPTPSPTPIPSSAPLLPLLLPHLSNALHFTTVRVPTYLTSHLPWTHILSPLTYIFAPFTTFASILLSITILTPYNIISWILDAIFPVYVLCGVACITGVLLGLGARLLSLGIVRVAASAPLPVIEDDSSEEQWHHDSDGLDEDESKIRLKGMDDAELVERRTKRRRLVTGKKRDDFFQFDQSG